MAQKVGRRERLGWQVEAFGMRILRLRHWETMYRSLVPPYGPVLPSTAAWAKAQEARNDVWRAKPEAKSTTRKRAAEYAKLAGHFSVWMTVFADDPEMRQLLIATFDGTSTICFDENASPVKRAGGRL